MRRRSLVKIAVLLLSTWVSLCAQAYTAAQERELYRLALLALETDQRAVFEEFKSRLEDYPLYPYLIYEYLSGRLFSASQREIEAFIETYADTPLAYQMRGLWLYKLYLEDRWRDFLKVYDGRAVVEYMCYSLRAKVRVGRLAGVIRGTKRLWLVGYSQHSACDPLFAWFATRPEFTQEIIWRRIELAMETGYTGLASYLADRLDARDRALVALWTRVYSDPQSVLADTALQSDGPVVRKIVTHAVARIADDDIQSGKAAWETVESGYAFAQDARDEVERDLALLAAYRHDPQALAMLEALPASALNDDVHMWRARTAIRSGDWLTVSQAIDQVEDTSEEPLMWRYWRARALEGIGDTARARAQYADLAKERDYYGFLAADRLGIDYSMHNEPLVKNPIAAGKLVGIPGIRRAYELLRVDAQTDAQREWNFVLSGTDTQQKRLAAVLAAKWGWHAEAIRLVALIEEFDDLALRFPTPYRDEVMFAARDRDLDPAWIYSVIRRESAFAAHAQSSAGALGLMQLMPATAALTAQHAGLPTPAGSEVLDVERNIQLGSAYLREMLDRFGGNEALATAAYNAGPHRVDQWLPRQGRITPDAWIETIPYYETRDYVKAVLAYTAVYESRLGHKPTPLARRMDTILPADQVSAHRLSESGCSVGAC